MHGAPAALLQCSAVQWNRGGGRERAGRHTWAYGCAGPSALRGQAYGYVYVHACVCMCGGWKGPSWGCRGRLPESPMSPMSMWRMLLGCRPASGSCAAQPRGARGPTPTPSPAAFLHQGSCRRTARHQALSQVIMLHEPRLTAAALALDGMAATPPTPSKCKRAHTHPYLDGRRHARACAARRRRCRVLVVVLQLVALPLEAFGRARPRARGARVSARARPWPGASTTVAAIVCTGQAPPPPGGNEQWVLWGRWPREGDCGDCIRQPALRTRQSHLLPVRAPGHGPISPSLQAHKLKLRRPPPCAPPLPPTHPAPHHRAACLAPTGKPCHASPP